MEEWRMYARRDGAWKDARIYRDFRQMLEDAGARLAAGEDVGFEAPERERGLVHRISVGWLAWMDRIKAAGHFVFPDPTYRKGRREPQKRSTCRTVSTSTSPRAATRSTCHSGTTSPGPTAPTACSRA